MPELEKGKPVVLTGARVLDSSGGWKSTDVTIQDDLIVDVGPGNPDMAQIVLDGKHLVPGLIDAHAHLGYVASLDHRDSTYERKLLTAHTNAMQHLKAGVTTVRDLGGPQTLNIELRNVIAERVLPGPDILSSGTFLAMTGGHIWHDGFEADGPVEVRRAVRQQFKAGADFVKLMATGGAARPQESVTRPEFTDEELAAGGDEASRANSYMAVHAHSAEAMLSALRAGAQTIEHGTFLTPEVVTELIERRAWVIPTFTVYERIAANTELSAAQRENAAIVCRAKEAAFMDAVELGLPYGVGTDAGGYLEHGALVEEMVAMRSVGLSDVDVLLAATKGNADALRLGDRGVIEPGKKASLVIVGDDPVQDVAALRKIEAVVHGGTWWNPKEMSWV